ncbi:MAG: histidine kinase [Bacteroidota bacterium]
MKLKYKILIHLAFWVYMFNQTLLGIVLMPGKSYDPFEEMTIYPLTSILTFYSIYFSVGLIFSKKKKLFPILLLIAVFFILVPFRVGLEYLFWKYIGFEHLLSEKALLINKIWWFNSLRLVIIFSIYALLVQLAIRWYESQKLKSELVLLTKASELALLRSQINPHFLFNTLNNIYSLVYTKSEEAPEAVMKMSAIMRYVLYDASADMVPLEKEIDYLKSFISLENIRLRQKDFVDLRISGKCENRTIAPMIFIPFVENAFKHGSRNCPFPGININLFIDKQWIQFEVINYLRKKDSGNKDNEGGIGIQNIRRRLDLLYPSHYKLEINQTKELYTVLLILWT